MKILVVEDDPTLNKNICEALIAENFIAESVFDGSLALRLLKKNEYDCVILDVNLPTKTGFEICKEFRVINTATPIILLTAFGDLEDKIEGFDAGADDYLTKPFYMRELILRINAIVKRGVSSSSVNSVEAQSIYADDIVVNTVTKKVFRQNTELVLTPREYQILLKLIENQGEFVSKNELIQEIWGTIVDVNTNTIEVYINFLRNKVDKPFGKSNIKTKVGYGYYFEDKNGN